MRAAAVVVQAWRYAVKTTDIHAMEEGEASWGAA
eukprot:COSAG02_NODE_50012_length_323_cov_0.852679_1_plen_33_part_10